MTTYITPDGSNVCRRCGSRFDPGMGPGESVFCSGLCRQAASADRLSIYRSAEKLAKSDQSGQHATALALLRGIPPRTPLLAPPDEEAVPVDLGEVVATVAADDDTSEWAEVQP